MVTGVLFLLLILAAFLDGVLSDVSGWEFWHSHLIGILLITYILAVYEPMRRLRDRAVEAFRPL